MKNKRLLIVEDDPFLSKVIGITLADQGYEIDKAMNGKEALEKIESQNYCLVLLDLIMPMMSGFDVLRMLKESGNKVPVIVFSNLSQDQDREEVLRLGAKDYFVKSNIPLDKVIAIVKEHTK